MPKRIPYDARTLRFAARYLRKYGRDDRQVCANYLDHLAKHEKRKARASGTK